MDTKTAAFEAIKPHAPTIREAVYLLILNSPDGMTCDELDLAGVRLQTATARVNELMKADRLYEYTRRPTRTGRMAVAYKAAT